MWIYISRTAGCLWLPAQAKQAGAFYPLVSIGQGIFHSYLSFFLFFLLTFFLGGGYADWQPLTHFWNYSNNSTGEGKDGGGETAIQSHAPRVPGLIPGFMSTTPITLKGGHHLFRGFVSQRSKSKWRVWDLKLQTKGRPRCCIRSPINFSWVHTMDHGAWSKMIFEILLLAFPRKQIPWVYFN